MLLARTSASPNSSCTVCSVRGERALRAALSPSGWRCSRASGARSRQAARREQVNARAVGQLPAVGSFPTRPAVLGEETGRAAGPPDQTGAVAADPDLALGPHERVKLAVGVNAVGTARLDVLIVDRFYAGRGS